MKKALCFVDKPGIFLPFEQISYCEFGANAGYTRGPTKNFNFDVVVGSQKYKFETMDKKEFPGFVEFLQKSGVKLKNLEAAKPKEPELPDEDEEDDEDFSEGDDSQPSSEEEDDESFEDEESEEERPKKKRKTDPALKNKKGG